jgi:dTDP-4-dehydrorhamnose 3,5-epimerase
MPFTFTKLAIPGVIKVEPKIFGDERGFFLEAFKASEFKAAGLDIKIVQSNHSRSVKNVLRGLHYQDAPHQQGKLIRCVSGKIFDVAVDIRKSSPTFGQWVGEYLCDDTKNLLYIPEGCAHGFCVVSESAEIIYYCTDEYAPECDRGIRWNDPTIGIKWPITDPILSSKDAVAPFL